MIAPLVIVCGTGTGIGKTHCAEALLGAFRRRFSRVTGLKPIETGVAKHLLSDAERLRQASSFHVEHSGYAFLDALSPHLAARRAGAQISEDVVRSYVDEARRGSDITLVELAGGLFTPISETVLNVDLVRTIRPTFSVLIAPDRLGVLHDVLATIRAAAAAGVKVEAVALVAPPVTDPSTGYNVPELFRFLDFDTIVALPRLDVQALSRHPALVELSRAATGRASDSRPGGRAQE